VARFGQKNLRAAMVRIAPFSADKGTVEMVIAYVFRRVNVQNFANSPAKRAFFILR
jgi:hypothetical protein